MSPRTNLVNLDAMIARADFADKESEDKVFETVSTISLRDFTKGGLIGPNLRKPDFQRETNHWSPEQVVSLLECFINGDLIPSVILWQSPTYLFVIDGGHRLSVLRAWVEDDYGDGPISQKFFGYEISSEQKKSADNTRKLLASANIDSWQHFLSKIDDNSEVPIPDTDRRRISTIISRGLPIQWVKGDPDKAATSFFKINTKGTPLDDVEELLLKNRKKSISIAARAVIRASKGHRYWSAFDNNKIQEIERFAKELHKVLFKPELQRPIKTLALPLGGAQAVRTALQILIEFILISNKNQQGLPKEIGKYPDDTDGSGTIEALKRSLKLAKRITGNDGGSLGLHPAVYFYGPTGRHSEPLFLGTAMLFSKKLAHNDQTFFDKFTTAREKLETILIKNKDLIATIVQKHYSKERADKYLFMLEGIIALILEDQEVDEHMLVSLSGFKGKKLVAANLSTLVSDTKKFSEDTKSEVFINTALSSALKCPICRGYLDPEKSVSYDHITRIRENGIGDSDNCQLTHPYCNQSVKQ